MNFIKLSLLISLFFFPILYNGTVSAQTDSLVEISDINFQGNESFAEDELKLVIASKETPSWFSQFLYSFTSFGEPAFYFDLQLMSADIQQLQKFYWANGFFEAFINATYSIDSVDNKAEIIFNVREGNPYKYGIIDRRGLKDKIPDELLFDIYSENRNDSTVTYSETVMKNQIDWTKSYLKDHGYMLAGSKTPVINIDTSSKYVQVLVNYDVGNRYKVNDVRVNITGLGKNLVEPALVKKLIGINPDDYYSYYNLQLAQIKLYRTGLFTSALVSGSLSDTSGSWVPINVSVDVGSLHELSPDIFVNDEDNAFNLGLGLSFVKKNFLGDARKFTVSASTAAQDIAGFLSHFSISDTTLFGYADARIILEQPMLFGKPIDTKLESYVTLQKRKNEYNATIYGTKLKFVYELPRYVYATYLSNYLNWEHARYLIRKEYFIQSFKYFAIRNGVPEDTLNAYLDTLNAIDPNSLVSRTTTAILGVEIGVNKINNLIFPTRGLSISLAFEDGNSLPFAISKVFGYEISSPLYYKALLTLVHYPGIYMSNTNAFAMKFRIGHIQAYRGNKADISLNQRFASGGGNSIRGWRTRELVPNEVSMPENLTLEEIESMFLRDALPGGFFLLEGSFETRNRILGPFGTALFVDYGNVWNSYTNFTWKSIAVALGFGLRYYSEFAPFRLDFGFKAYDPLDPRSFMQRLDDPGGIWNTLEFHVGIGEAF
ncbi:MAG: BamA/TamA family outer membrane protein [bacterium]